MMDCVMVPSVHIQRLSFVLCLTAAAAVAFAQEAKPAPPKKKIALHCGSLIDTRTGRVLPDALILIENDRVTRVGPNVPTLPGYETIDVGKRTCLPGLIDSHTHIMAEGSEEYDDQLLKQSSAYRAVRATAIVKG